MLTRSGERGTRTGDRLPAYNRIDLRQDQDNLVGAQLRAPLPQPREIQGWRAVLRDSVLEILHTAVLVALVEHKAGAFRHLRTPDQRASDRAICAAYEFVRGNLGVEAGWRKSAGPAVSSFAPCTTALSRSPRKLLPSAFRIRSSLSGRNCRRLSTRERGRRRSTGAAT